MAIEIPGRTFDSITRKVNTLAKKGIKTFMSNGKFYCESVYDLLKSGCVTFKELNLNKVQEAIAMEKEAKRNKRYNYMASGKRVFISENQKKFIYIIRQINMKTGDFEYIMVAKDAGFKKIKLDNTLGQGMTSFELDFNSPILTDLMSDNSLRKSYSTRQQALANNKAISEDGNASLEFKVDPMGRAFLNVSSTDFLTMDFASANLGNSPLAKKLYDSIQNYEKNKSVISFYGKMRDKVVSHVKRLVPGKRKVS